MQKRTTIAIVDNSTWSIYNFRLTLIRRLTALGHQVLVIAPVDEFIHYLNDSYFTKHIPLHHLKAHNTNPFFDALLAWELWKIYKKEKPDLVIHFTIKPNIFGNLAARWAGIPSISTVTGLGYTFLHDQFSNRIVPFLYRFAFRKVKQVVFYNEEDRTYFEKQRFLPHRKGRIISGSGINTNHFRPLPTPVSERFIFLFIGRLLTDKGLREFVEAAKKLTARHRNVECWVIGALNDRNPASISKDMLVEWIDARYIRYFGLASDVRQYIKKAHVIVLPSYREGVPRSLLEGMAMGKPIITTDTPGCRETVDIGRNGVIVPARDGQALCQAMEKLMLLPDYEREFMGERSRDLALQRFDDKIIASNFIQLIHEVLGESFGVEEKREPMGLG